MIADLSGYVNALGAAILGGFTLAIGFRGLWTRRPCIISLRVYFYILAALFLAQVISVVIRLLYLRQNLPELFEVEYGYFITAEFLICCLMVYCLVVLWLLPDYIFLGGSEELFQEAVDSSLSEAEHTFEKSDKGYQLKDIQAELTLTRSTPDAYTHLLGIRPAKHRRVLKDLILRMRQFLEQSDTLSSRTCFIALLIFGTVILFIPFMGVFLPF